jgi:hypothetical protein
VRLGWFLLDSAAEALILLGVVAIVATLAY